MSEFNNYTLRCSNWSECLSYYDDSCKTHSNSKHLILTCPLYSKLVVFSKDEVGVDARQLVTSALPGLQSH